MDVRETLLLPDSGALTSLLIVFINYEVALVLCVLFFYFSHSEILERTHYTSVPTGLLKNYPRTEESAL